MEYILISRNTEILDINQCICQLCVSSCARETEKNNTSTTLFCNLFGECPAFNNFNSPTTIT